MDLQTIADYLPREDCLALREVAGPAAVSAARWQSILLHTHKQRFASTLGDIRKIEYGSPYEWRMQYGQIENISMKYIRFGCATRARYTRFNAPYPNLTAISHTCEKYRCDKRKASQISQRPLRYIGAWFADELHNKTKFTSPSGNYQIVELEYKDVYCITIFSMLIPCEMMNYDKNSDCKIVDHYKRFVRK
jgi:hypothetical protein